MKIIATILLCCATASAGLIDVAQMDDNNATLRKILAVQQETNELLRQQILELQAMRQSFTTQSNAITTTLTNETVVRINRRGFSQTNVVDRVVTNGWGTS